MLSHDKKIYLTAAQRRHQVILEDNLNEDDAVRSMTKIILAG
jgi:hypothetical protein